MPKEKPKPKGK